LGSPIIQFKYFSILKLMERPTVKLMERLIENLTTRKAMPVVSCIIRRSALRVRRGRRGRRGRDEEGRKERGNQRGEG
jgi:hypothetical protein